MGEKKNQTFLNLILILEEIFSWNFACNLKKWLSAVKFGSCLMFFHWILETDK